MSSRSLRDSFGGRNIPVVSRHRRGQSLNGGFPAKDSDENLDLFSRNRRSFSVASSDEFSDVSVKLGRLSVGPIKVPKSGIDDLLNSTDGGKHDYDWLLTPPETPLFASSDGIESHPTTLAPRSNSTVRSISTIKGSRLSLSQSESNHSARPTRSSSVTRSSPSTSYSTYSSNRGPSILNASSASVSSYTRPSSPITRSPSIARPSTPSTRPTLSRSSTPSKPRPPLTNSSIDKTRPTQSSRPSTPSSRPQIPANLNSTVARSNSRPSTPTRRNSTPSLSSPASASSSVGRVVSNGRNVAPASRASSPSPRVRPPPQPIVPPDFPLDTPPNLRTTLPDRPLSAGRSRPSVSVTTKANQDTIGPVSTRRHSSPIITRGRLTEPPGRGRIHSNGHASDIHEPRKTSLTSDLAMRKPVKSSMTTAESNGFGRTISKKSLDMAMRHMDIRNGTGSIRQLSGTTLFPQSIRSAAAKTQPAHTMNALDTISINGSIQNSDVSENGSYISRPVENGSDVNDGRYNAKLGEADIYESSRYDAILLKEDLKNTNWLHSIDDKSDQGPIFDTGFEPLPEPFGQL
ncbi:hypothetical protein SLEP1_g16478 [Rubroshorea leprosula]|uniref:Uncharacterized protein n=1 Tax=Rubroshorea leprosula TaxID=152421 RepID=A0AAV5J087_9ROSI|nr:hypothetical protein SLEP1_g16478 [Rubroshorea leprosula]